MHGNADILNIGVVTTIFLKRIFFQTYHICGAAGILFCIHSSKASMMFVDDELVAVEVEELVGCRIGSIGGVTGG